MRKLKWSADQVSLELGQLHRREFRDYPGISVQNQIYLN